MPSSEPIAPERAITYAFAQLDTPPGIAVRGAPADVITAAHAEAEAIRERARREGEAEGHRAGVEAARGEVASLLAALAAAAEQVAAVREELSVRLERDAAELALAVAEQIIAGALELAPERVVDIARGVLRRIADRHRVTLVCHPDDLELLAAASSALRAELGGIDHLDVQADRRIGRGGAVGRTESGEIDASVTAQLQAARDVVLAALTDGDG